MKHQKGSANPCVHHWIIDATNYGKCKFCSAEKNFGKLLDQQERRKAINQRLSSRGGKKSGETRRKRRQ